MGPASKKRKLGSTAPAEITFDFAAREEYLTGFHKRKLERIKHAQTEAAKKEKEERLKMRADLRRQRKEDLEAHVNEVNSLLRKAAGLPTDDEASDSENSDEFQGFEDDEPAAAEPDIINQEDEYIDEDKYTTVTVETVGIDQHGFSRPGEKTQEDLDKEKYAELAKKEKRVWTKERPKNNYPKKKKKKFRYESPAERKANRQKIGMKKKAAAEKRKE